MEQKFAWNSSCLSNDEKENRWLDLADALFESSCEEEFKIKRDLLALDIEDSIDEDDRKK